MRSATFCVVSVFILIMSLTAVAEPDVPDLKGTWVGTDQGARHYRTPELRAKGHLKEKTPFPDIAFTVTIDKQEGFKFSGKKVSDNWTEYLSGVIGFDNKTVYMVDDNGFIFCRLVAPDKMEQIYLHITDEHSVAARGTLTRKR